MIVVENCGEVNDKIEAFGEVSNAHLLYFDVLLLLRKLTVMLMNKEADIGTMTVTKKCKCLTFPQGCAGDRNRCFLHF